MKRWASPIQVAVLVGIGMLLAFSVVVQVGAVPFPVQVRAETSPHPEGALAPYLKLASLGVPNVLVYLGFIGDTGIDYVSPHFESEGHRERTIRDYTAGVLPHGFLDCPIPCGAATLQLLIRSLPAPEPTEVTWCRLVANVPRSKRSWGPYCTS